MAAFRKAAALILGDDRNSDWRGIARGKSTRNGLTESLNARLCDGSRTETPFLSLPTAGITMAVWRKGCNSESPRRQARFFNPPKTAEPEPEGGSGWLEAQ